MMKHLDKAKLVAICALTFGLLVCLLAMAGCGSKGSAGGSDGSTSNTTVAPASQTETTTTKTSYNEGEKVTLDGTVGLKYSSNTGFNGEILWAYIALDEPITISGSANGTQTMSRLQVDSDVSLDSGSGTGKLSIPGWEPYDGMKVTVTGTLKGTPYNMYWLDAYWLEGAYIVRS